VLVGSAFEGDFTLILAGVVAHLGIFAFPLAVAAGTLGSLVADIA
jgi:membrane protein DedA with SNARE-associated domain